MFLVGRSVTLESEFCVVLPVVNFWAKFGMETTEVTEEICIIVLEISQGSRKFISGIVVNCV